VRLHTSTKSALGLLWIHFVTHESCLGLLWQSFGPVGCEVQVGANFSAQNVGYACIAHIGRYEELIRRLRIIQLRCCLRSATAATTAPGL